MWGGGQPRLAWELLTRPFIAEGFKVPDLELYYICAQAHFAAYWMQPPPYMPHLAVEDGYMRPIPSTAYLSTPTVPRHVATSTVQCTTSAWRDLATRLQSPLLYSPLLPLHSRQDLPVTQEGACRRMLRNISRLTWGQLYTRGTFCTSADFFGTHPPTPLELFYYVRLRLDIRALTPAFPREPPVMPPLHAMLQQSSPAHVVSLLYRATQLNWDRPPAPAKDKWEVDLGHPITNAQWAFCCQQTEMISASSRFRLFHYKYLHRTYHTPDRLYRLKLRETYCCDRCGQAGAGFRHLAWDCPLIQAFWWEVLAATGEMTGEHRLHTPLVALLGYTQQLAAKIRKYTSLVLLLAKRLIACRWGRGRAPKFKDWLTEITHCQEQLQTYAELMPASSRPRDIWAPLQAYLLTRSSPASNTATPTIAAVAPTETPAADVRSSPAILVGALPTE